MLLPILPLPLVLPPIRPLEHPISMLLITSILPTVLPSVAPREQPAPMHLAVLPLALVASSIVEEVLAVALEVVVDDVPDEELAIC